MLHVPASRFADAAPAQLASAAPLSPAEYLRLRREAAGVPFERAAEALTPNKDERAGARAFLRLIETKGARVNDDRALRLLQRVYPFDIDVYWQLANDPADRHPAVCRARGCTSWVIENICAPGEGCRA